jgi:hypothetical protein
VVSQDSNTKDNECSKQGSSPFDAGNQNFGFQSQNETLNFGQPIQETCVHESTIPVAYLSLFEQQVTDNYLIRDHEFQKLD